MAALVLPLQLMATILTLCAILYGTVTETLVALVVTGLGSGVRSVVTVMA